MKNWIKIWAIVLGVSSIQTFGQTLASQLDKKSLALGEVASFKIVLSDVGGKTIQAAPKNELLPFHFEVVKDSIAEDSDTYIRTIDFAVYEEGKFTIPKLDVKVGDQVLHTVPYEVEVFNTSQKGDQINDILKNKEVKLQAADYWELYKWYVLAFFAVVALIFLIVFIRKYARKQKAEPVVNSNKTLKALDALKKKGYMESGDFRPFYVDLLDITRDFITAQYKIPANVLLTDDLMTHIHDSNVITQESEAVLSRVFTTGDMVKFAKTFPTQNEMSQDFEAIRSLVKRSVKDVELDNLR